MITNDPTKMSTHQKKIRIPSAPRFVQMHARSMNLKLHPGASLMGIFSFGRMGLHVFEALQFFFSPRVTSISFTLGFATFFHDSFKFCNHISICLGMSVRWLFDCLPTNLIFLNHRSQAQF